MSYMKEMDDEEKGYEAKCLAEKILDVQMAKMKKPELYKQAMSMLADKKTVINSLADLKKVAQEKMVAATEEQEDDSE